MRESQGQRQMVGTHTTERYLARWLASQARACCSFFSTLCFFLCSSFYSCLIGLPPRDSPRRVRSTRLLLLRPAYLALLPLSLSLFLSSRSGRSCQAPGLLPLLPTLLSWLLTPPSAAAAFRNSLRLRLVFFPSSLLPPSLLPPLSHFAFVPFLSSASFPVPSFLPSLFFFHTFLSSLPFNNLIRIPPFHLTSTTADILSPLALHYSIYYCSPSRPAWCPLHASRPPASTLRPFPPTPTQTHQQRNPFDLPDVLPSKVASQHLFSSNSSIVSSLAGCAFLFNARPARAQLRVSRRTSQNAMPPLPSRQLCLSCASPSTLRRLYLLLSFRSYCLFTSWLLLACISPIRCLLLVLTRAFHSIVRFATSSFLSANRHPPLSTFLTSLPSPPVLPT